MSAKLMTLNPLQSAFIIGINWVQQKYKESVLVTGFDLESGTIDLIGHPSSNEEFKIDLSKMMENFMAENYLGGRIKTL